MRKVLVRLRVICLALLVTLATCAGCGFARTAISPASRQPFGKIEADKHHFDRVLIVVLENEDGDKAILDPNLRSFAKRGANFTDFHGLFHPSYSNYLAMVAGKEYVTQYDGQIDITDSTIGDRLTAAGKTWKNYAEDYPGGCRTDSRIGKYARKHVPFMSFTSVRKDHCDQIVPVDPKEPNNAFWKDVKDGKLPDYAFYSPNLDNDGHDTGLKYASDWLTGFLERLLQNRELMSKTLIVVTFDESGAPFPSSSDPNQIYTIFLGDMVNPGDYAGSYNHYNVLRTIEDNFGLCPLADGDGGARPIRSDSGVWK